MTKGQSGRNRMSVRANPVLVSYHCPVCGQWLCETLLGSRVRREKCGGRGAESRKVVQPGEVRGYTRREQKRLHKGGNRDDSGEREELDYAGKR